MSRSCLVQLLEAISGKGLQLFLPLSVEGALGLRRSEWPVNRFRSHWRSEPTVLLRFLLKQISVVTVVHPGGGTDSSAAERGLLELAIESTIV